MGNRRNTLSNKLSNKSNQPSWRDTITPQEPVEEEAPQQPRTQPRRRTRTTSKNMKKTYIVSQEMVEQIEIIAEDERVGINELVRFMLSHSIDAINNGKLKIPTQEGKRTITK